MKSFPLVRGLQAWVTRKVLSVAFRLDMSGFENLPASGPFIIVWNHLHITDGLLLWSLLPQSITFVSTAKFRKSNPLIHRYIVNSGAILLKDGGLGRNGVRQALAVLASGGAIAIAPEGKISVNGVLSEAEPGVASLICHSRARIVPVAVWGQHKAHRLWAAGRRPLVSLRIGPAIDFAAGAPSSANRRALTISVMKELARALPEQYRGVYAETQPETSLCG